MKAFVRAASMVALLGFAGPAAAQVSAGLGLGQGNGSASLGVGLDQSVISTNANTRIARDPLPGGAAVTADASGSTDLRGLGVGTTIRSTTGEVMGTVSDITRASDGAPINITLHTPAGAHRPVAPGSLSTSAGVWTSTDLGLTPHR